jgi:hypothetical protein
MAEPSFVMLDFLLALENEAVAAGLRAEGTAEKTIWVADQAELAVAVGTLIKATRLLHDCLQGEKLGHAVIRLATDASVADSNDRCSGAVIVDHGQPFVNENITRRI